MLTPANLFITTIDTLYDVIIEHTIRFVYMFVRQGTPEPHTPEIHFTEPISVVEEETPHTFRTMQEILTAHAQVPTVVQKNTIMYAGNVATPLYQNPTVEFDSQIGIIPYGEMVMMMEPRGRFSRVIWNSLEGWIFRDDLVDRAIGVYPEFVVGQENSVDHSNTAHVRAILSDTFGLGRSEFPLQAGEYVLFRLWKKSIHLAWPSIRPRTPGLWHKILRGVKGVHIGVAPKVGSIMEYMLDSDVGHLAYVEAVFPDNTISVSEVNYPDSGIYNERELTKEEWKELRPVFINIT